MFFGIGLVEPKKVLVKMIKYMEYILFSHALLCSWLRRFDIKSRWHERLLFSADWLQLHTLPENQKAWVQNVFVLPTRKQAKEPKKKGTTKYDVEKNKYNIISEEKKTLLLNLKRAVTYVLKLIQELFKLMGSYITIKLLYIFCDTSREP